MYLLAPAFLAFLLNFSALLIQTGSLHAQDQLCVAIGGTGDDEGHSMVQTSDGGYVIAGQTNSFGAGDIDVYIVKISSTGALQWTRTVGGTGKDYGRSVVQTLDGGYAIAGFTNSFGAGNDDYYIIKLDASGTVLWTKTIGGTGRDAAEEIVQAADGTLGIAGQTSSFNAGPNDMYIVKLDASGTLIWDKRIGNSTADIAYSITNTADGGFAVCGTTFFFTGSVSTSSVDYYIVKLDGATGALVWSQVILNPSPGNYYPDYARCIKQTADGGFIVSGESGQPGSSGGYDSHMLVVKLRADGSVEWKRYYGGLNIQGVSIDNSDYGESVFQTADGGYIVGGYSFSFNFNFATGQQAGLELFMVKLSATGDIQWTRVLGDTENEIGKTIIQTSDGGYAMAGYLQPRVSGQGIVNEQVYFVKLDASLNTCCPTRIIGGDRGTGGTLTTSGAGLDCAAIENTGGTTNSGGTLAIYQPCNVTLTVNTSSTNISCKGECTGTATAEPANGTLPHSYSWSPGLQTTATINGLCAGDYTVTVTDGVGDSEAVTVTILEPDSVLSSTLIPAAATCSGLCNGTVQFAALGGSPSYTYTYAPTPSGTGFCAGNYTGIVTDNNGCTDSIPFIIDEPEPLVLSSSAVDVNCGSSEGAATVTVVSGGTGPFEYSWNTTPVQTTATAIALPAGNYTVTVTDASDCSQTRVVNVGNIGGGTASIAASTPASCFGAADGSATASIAGGVAPYTYAWNTTPVQTDSTATGLAAGDYICTITASNGCIASVTATISQPGQIITTFTASPADCGAANGSASVSITSGGVSPFSYSWNTNPVQSGSAATNLSAGSYTCTVTDANGCSEPVTVIVDSEGGGSASIQGGNNITCFGGTDGTSTVAVAGGQTPYTYAWNTTPVQTTATAANLAAGIYSVTVTDANGCVKTVTDTLTEPSELLVTASSTPACGSNNGSASATAEGGILPYTYNWTPSGATTASISGLSNGVYTLTITDENGCVESDTVAVSTKPAPIAFAGEDITIRIGSDTTLSASGGGTYSWFPVEGLSCSTCPNPVANPMITTTYAVTVRAENGCSSVDSVTVFVDIDCGEVFVPNAFSPNADSENDLECVFGNCFKTFRLLIYDRWGEKVFESDNQKVCWDGTYKGKPMSAAVFVYYLEGDLITGGKVQKKGDINLIR